MASRYEEIKKLRGTSTTPAVKAPAAPAVSSSTYKSSYTPTYTPTTPPKDYGALGNLYSAGKGFLDNLYSAPNLLGSAYRGFTKATGNVLNTLNKYTIEPVSRFAAGSYDKTMDTMQDPNATIGERAWNSVAMPGSVAAGFKNVFAEKFGEKPVKFGEGVDVSRGLLPDKQLISPQQGKILDNPVSDFLIGKGTLGQLTSSLSNPRWAANLATEIALPGISLSGLAKPVTAAVKKTKLPQKVGSTVTKFLDKNPDIAIKVERMFPGSILPEVENILKNEKILTKVGQTQLGKKIESLAKGLSDKEKKIVGMLMEGGQAAGASTKLKDIANQMNEISDYIGKLMVDEGLMTAESFNKYKGRYLSRIKKDVFEVMTEEGLKPEKVFRSANYAQGANIGQLKKREGTLTDYERNFAPVAQMGLGNEIRAVNRSKAIGEIVDKYGKPINEYTPISSPVNEALNELLQEGSKRTKRINKYGLGTQIMPGYSTPEGIGSELLDVYKKYQPARRVVGEGVGQDVYATVNKAGSKATKQAESLVGYGTPEYSLPSLFTPNDVQKVKKVGQDRLYDPELLKKDPSVMWHGSPKGTMTGGKQGLHIGTYEVAQDALTSRIGYPKEGMWDGTREYGKTLIMGKKSMEKAGITPTGFTLDFPENDFYPSKAIGWDKPNFTLKDKPTIQPVKLKGQMTNTPQNPMQDFQAGGRMAGQIKKGNAKSGYYYLNVGEGVKVNPKTGEIENSISAVVPNKDFLEIVQPKASGVGGDVAQPPLSVPNAKGINTAVNTAVGEMTEQAQKPIKLKVGEKIIEEAPDSFVKLGDLPGLPEVFRKKYENVALPKVIAQKVVDAYVINKPNFADRLINLWKGFKTTLAGSPAYFVRNQHSNITQAAMDTGRNIVHAAQDNMISAAELLGIKKFVKNVNPRYLQEFNEISSSYNNYDRVKKLLNTSNKFDFKKMITGEYVKEFQTFQENSAKFSIFKFWRDKGDDVMTAWDKADKAIFSPYRISGTEKGLMKFLIPFYQWQRQEIPYFIRTYADHPERYAAYTRLKEGVEKLSSEPKIPLPDYMQGQIRLPSKDTSGDQMYLDLTYNVPFGSFLKGAGENDMPFGFNYNPIADLPSILRGKHPQYGTDLTKSADPKEQAAARTKALLETFGPTAIKEFGTNLPAALRGEEEKYTNKKRTLGQWVLRQLGTKITSYSEDKQRLMNRFELLDLIDKDRSFRRNLLDQYKRNAISRETYLQKLNAHKEEFNKQRQELRSVD